MNKLDSFDKALKDSLENYEVEYDPSQWSRLESKLGRKPGYTWLAVASVIVIAGSVLIYSLIPTPGQTVTHPVVVQEEIPSVSINNNSESIKGNAPDEIISEDHSTKEFMQEVPELVNSNNTETNLNQNNKALIKETNNNAVPIIDNNESVNNLGNNTIKNNNIKNSIKSNTLPEPSFALEKNEVCQGDELTLQAINAPQGAEVYWEISNGAILTGKKVKAVFDFPGRYVVRLHYSTDKQVSNLTEQYIEVLAAPEAEFTWEERIDNGRPYIVFSNRSINSIGSKWIFEDGTGATDQDAKRFYRYSGEYPVQLEVQSVNGCKAIAKETVYVEEEYRLFAPNSFSPNGDGQNDYFIPAALKVTDKEFTMTIYDRSGKLVYSTRSADRPWDGRYMDNQLAPAGVYVWMVTIKGEQPYGGSVTLLER